MDNDQLPFNSLPGSVQEYLLREMELDYDGYESSKAETVHDIMHGDCSPTNELIIKNYMLSMSKEVLCVRLAVLTLEAFNTAKRCQMLITRLSP